MRADDNANVFGME